MKLLNSAFHLHEYGKMDEKGYQSCIHCGKTFYVGLPEINSEWEILERIEVKNSKGRIIKIVYIQKCKQTGELKHFTAKW